MAPGRMKVAPCDMADVGLVGFMDVVPCRRHRVARGTPLLARRLPRGEATIVRIVSTMGHCVVKNPAAGGGRWVEVPPERLVTWVVTFAERHGGAAAGQPVTTDESGVAVTFTGADGATAECHPPFPPLPAEVPGAVRAAAEALAAHAAADRTVGVLLVRLGGYAAGVFSGS